MDKVKPLKIEKGMKVSELVERMKDAGFGARKIGRASEIVKKMFADKECRVFFGMAGAMVPAGMKQIVIDLINEKKIDVMVTTGANLTHDLIEALGESHYHCDTWDDEDFHKKGFDRMYNVLMKNEVYPMLEDFFEKHWNEFKECKTIKEFLSKIGEILSKKNNSQNGNDRKISKRINVGGGEGVRGGLGGAGTGGSILQACYEKDVQLYCPALADSGIGLMIWGRKAAGKEIFIDAFEDMKEIIDFAWTSKKSGVIYIGGGVPKNFIQQSLQFSKGADYGVQITQDAEAGALGRRWKKGRAGGS